MSAMVEAPSAYAIAAEAVRTVDADIVSMQTTYNTDLAKLKLLRAKAQEIIDHAERGGDAESFVVAQRILEIRWGRQMGNGQSYSDYPRTGPVKVTGEVTRQINAAINELRSDSDYLMRGYFGVKSYDRWESQVEDHPYNYGPRHGSIWFSIGFQYPYRDAKNRPSEDERLACIRYLTAVRDNPALMGGESA
jgi:hypothetical protein